ncbi:protein DETOXIFICATION 27-like isoform X5 [Manihot esculenta]|uniref:Uncharacterized protein n=1 Tax=Manihot esculenta TaxID=3983 RepID=A0ACB7FZC8_MANES|nr:protein DETOXIFICATION 27-like isoform X5 [Manihot esculenta]KAG8632870.1 hypothetical protein MANES_18G062732v8 [Manihot esculenta]
MFSMTVITQAFAGHLGDLNLAAISIATTVIISFSFGFLLGMASALETLCGQAYGAKQYQMLGIYLQRSWIVLFLWSILLLPMFLFATPILKLIGQPAEVAEQTGLVAIWLKAGIVATAITLDFSWWVSVLGMLCYCVCGGCPLTWTGFSTQAFVGLWSFFKLSLASGVMLLLENFYYRVLIIVSGYMHNTEVAVDALSICIGIYAWESMIPLGFLAATGVRVANELGAGNAKGAKFATKVSVLTSLAVGFFFWLIVIAFPEKLAMIFTSSSSIISMVKDLAVLLSFTILLNCIQPVLSGVAVGSRWQALVAYINIGSYYIVGVPLGACLGWLLHFGFTGIWAGMLIGTVVQTLILIIITMKCEWEKEYHLIHTYGCIRISLHAKRPFNFSGAYAGRLRSDRACPLSFDHIIRLDFL